MPVLAYRDDEDEKNFDGDTPRSSEDLEKIKELKESMNKYSKLDSLFGASGIRE